MDRNASEFISECIGIYLREQKPLQERIFTSRMQLNNYVDSDD